MLKHMHDSVGEDCEILLFTVCLHTSSGVNTAHPAGLIFRCLDLFYRGISALDSAWKVSYTDAEICMVVCTTGHFLVRGGPVCTIDTADLIQ